jgi:hypothetical protein
MQKKGLRLLKTTKSSPSFLQGGAVNDSAQSDIVNGAVC